MTETLAAVVKSEPTWALLPEGTPPAIRTLLRQCLQKQPQSRLRDARSARLALDEALIEPALVTARGDAREVPSALLRWRWALGGVALAAAALAGWALRPTPAVDRAVTHVSLDVAPAERLVGSRGASPRPSRTALAVSPDGRTVVFTGVRGVRAFCQAPRRSCTPRSVMTATTPAPVSWPIGSPQVSDECWSRTEPTRATSRPATCCICREAR